MHTEINVAPTDLARLAQSRFAFDPNSLESPPNCFIFGLYTLASVEAPVPSIAKLFAEHSFSFRPDHHSHPALIHPETRFARFEFFRDQTGPYLDVHARHVDGKMADLLRERCGLEIEVIPFTDFAALLEYIGERFSRQRPVLCDFDMGYIPSRYQYQLIRGYEHIVFLTQYCPAQSRFLLSDQDVQDDPVAMQDVSACFDGMLKLKGVFNCYQVKRVGVPSPYLSMAEICQDVGENVAHLTTGQSEAGMAAVKHYLEGMAQVKALNQPFYIFGHWIFLTQRKLQVRWCELARQTLTAPAQCAALADLQHHLRRLTDRWGEFTMLDNLSRSTQRVTPAQVAQRCMDAARLELESPRYWQALQATL
ncbi:hypothetical protein VV869_04885 [Photobacterium sp. MCCC 1A19761]|uniref:hypothetical protein n=1 Tax=Photobacterium sp. MCCC 1A19761 TaxID=3115000 RepID=UPI00307F161D